MKIGIIGAGRVGSTLAGLWADAGHQVVISSRHPVELTEMVVGQDENLAAGAIEDAADFGDVVVLAIPLAGIIEVLERAGSYMVGKIVIDAMNPFPSRDGELALEIRRRNIAAAQGTQELMPDATVVRAFSSIPFRDLQMEAHRSGMLLAVPFAADDPRAGQVVEELIHDAGFEPYDMGYLSDSQPQDPGGLLFGKALTAIEVRDILAHAPV
jgi:hypothetical protein